MFGHSGVLGGIERTTFKFPAYSAAFIDKSIDDGDKIILPPSVLHALVNRYGTAEGSMPHPLVFELTNNAISRVTHAGVLEFTAPNSAAYLPSWMMANLMVDEGASLTVRVKSLPKLLQLKLQPVEHNFTELPTPKQTLEYALRKFTTLTVGDTIQIGHSQQRYHLKVIDLQPKTCRPAAASVIDTDPTVEFDEPIEAPVKDVKESIIAIDETVTDSVSGDSYHYYRVKANDRERSLRIDCQSLTGQADVYVSEKNYKPNISDHTWRTTITNSVVIIDRNDAGFVNNQSLWFYVSVHAYKQSASYKLTVTEIGPSQSQSQSLSHSSSQSSGLTLGPSQAAANSSESSYCDNCHQWISKKQFGMHSIQCARINVWCPQCSATVKRSEAATHAHCPQCNVAMHRDELSKHVDLLHSSAKCVCGALVPGEAMDAHKANDCPLRLLTCDYCQILLPSSEMPAHVEYEKAKSIPCELCGANVSRKRMNNHLAAEHGINPSLRSDDRVNITRVTPASTISQSPPVQHSPLLASVPTPYANGWFHTAPHGDPLAEAIRASRREAGLEEEDEDAQLARVLAESQREAEVVERQTQSSNSTITTTTTDSNTTTRSNINSDTAAVNRSNSVDGEEFGSIAPNDDALQSYDDWDEEEDDTHFDDGLAVNGATIRTRTHSTGTGGTVSSGGGHGAPRELVLCPYCHSEFDGMDRMVEHMQSCEFMTDD